MKNKTSSVEFHEPQGKFNKHKISFEEKRTSVTDFVRNKLGIILIATGIGLGSSSIMYTGLNTLNNSDGDSVQPAQTLFTDLRGIKKTDLYGKDIPGKDWEYTGSKIEKNGDIPSSIDYILGFPGNGMIFISGVLLVAFGMGKKVDKRDVVLQQIKSALLRGEEVTIVSNGEGNKQREITISFKSITSNQTQLIIDEVNEGSLKMEKKVVKIGIEEYIDNFLQNVFSNLILAK